MGIIYFIILTGGIGPRVHLILILAAPRVAVLTRGGSYFVHRVRNECLGVEWEVCICLGLGFPEGGSGYLPEELVKGSSLFWP